MARSRRWVFTINNYTDEDLATCEGLVEDVRTLRLIVGKEVGKSGTPHIQGYVRFASAVTTKSCCTRLGGRAAVFTARGDEESNEAYCSKESIWINHGENARPGKRSDLAGIRDQLMEHGSVRRVIEETEKLSYQGLRMAELLPKYIEKARDWQPEVYWYWGPTGAGKTRRAFEEAKDPYITSGNMKWWDGYDAHEDVIMDDFRADSMTFSMLLRLLDRYPVRVEFKGGSRQFLAKRIWITCDRPPEELYPSGRDTAQLKRRITHCLEMCCAEVSAQGSRVILGLDLLDGVD